MSQARADNSSGGKARLPAAVDRVVRVDLTGDNSHVLADILNAATEPGKAACRAARSGPGWAPRTWPRESAWCRARSAGGLPATAPKDTRSPPRTSGTADATTGKGHS